MRLRHLPFSPATLTIVSLATAQMACSGGGTGSRDREASESLSSALSATGAPIVSAIGDRCLDDSGDSTANETKIQIYGCNGTAAQSWALTGGTLVGPGGKCLDIKSDDQVAGTDVQLYQCNGTRAQKWTVAGKTIKSTSGLCLDVHGGVNANGTQVDLAACNGSASQEWTVGGAPSAPDAGGPTTSGATFWVYDDGVFNWGGDYSFAASANYKDTSGKPEDGSYDIAVSVTGAWGGFQPYAGGTVPTWDFDDAGYNYLVMDLKPTVDGQKWNCLFHSVGDIAIGDGVSINDYGPAPVKGQWTHFKIPLKDVGVYDNGGASGIYKFFIQDQTGLSTNLFYVDKLGFTVD